MTTHAANPKNTAPPTATRTDLRDWRCACFSLLGRRRRNRLEVRHSRGHQYTMSLPVAVVCRCCGRLNELLPAPRAR